MRERRGTLEVRPVLSDLSPENMTPDSFTHGSSEQRVRWFKQGLESGDVLDCNTFRADNL